MVLLSFLAIVAIVAFGIYMALRVAFAVFSDKDMSEKAKRKANSSILAISPALSFLIVKPFINTAELERTLEENVGYSSTRITIHLNSSDDEARDAIKREVMNDFYRLNKQIVHRHSYSLYSKTTSYEKAERGSVYRFKDDRLELVTALPLPDAGFDNWRAMVNKAMATDAGRRRDQPADIALTVVAGARSFPLKVDMDSLSLRGHYGVELVPLTPGDCRLQFEGAVRIDQYLRLFLQMRGRFRLTYSLQQRDVSLLVTAMEFLRGRDGRVLMTEHEDGQYAQVSIQVDVSTEAGRRSWCGASNYRMLPAPWMSGIARKRYPGIARYASSVEMKTGKHKAGGAGWHPVEHYVDDDTVLKIGEQDASGYGCVLGDEGAVVCGQGLGEKKAK